MIRVFYTICGTLLATVAFAGCQADTVQAPDDVQVVSEPPPPEGPASEPLCSPAVPTC